MEMKAATMPVGQQPTVLLCEVKVAELGSSLAVGRVRLEDERRALTLSANNATHPVMCTWIV